MTTNEPPVGPDPNEPGSTPEPSGPPSYPPPSESTPPPEPPVYGSAPDSGGAGYPPPPPPPGMGANQPFSAPDAIGYGWKKWTADVTPWLLLGLVALGLFVVYIAIATLSSIGDVLVGSNTRSVSFLTVVVFFILSVAFTIALSILNAVGVRGALDGTEGRAFDLGGAFGRIDLAKVAVLSIILAVVNNLGSSIEGFIGGLLSLVALVFTFFTYFAMVFVVDRGLDPIEAISASFELIKANLGQSLLLAILSFLVILAGTCLCFVGLFVAYPVVTIASAYAYKRFQNQPVV